MKIKNNYYKIVDCGSNIDNIINILHEKSLYLKCTYETLIKENYTIDVITTDTFGFQNNIFDIKVQNNVNVYSKICVQIYGDYYKLLRYITGFLEKYINNSENNSVDETLMSSIKLIENVEPFRLNNNKYFSIKNANKINNYIIDILEILTKNYKKTSDKIKSKEKSLNRGINIETYIQNIKYNNENLKNNIELFNNFLIKYNDYHIKYLETLQTDLKNLYDSVVKEIDFNNINLKKYKQEEDQDLSNNIIVKTKGYSLMEKIKYKMHSIKKKISFFAFIKYTLKINILVVCLLTTTYAYFYLSINS